MGSIEAVLREELQRLRVAEKSYQRAMKGLPKGSIQHKRIKGRPYPYLAFRKAGKVAYRYLGRLSQDDLKAFRNGIEQRVRYERLCAEVRKSQRRLQRMIRGTRRAI